MAGPAIGTDPRSVIPRLFCTFRMRRELCNLLRLLLPEEMESQAHLNAAVAFIPTQQEHHAIRDALGALSSARVRAGWRRDREPWT